LTDWPAVRIASRMDASGFVDFALELVREARDQTVHRWAECCEAEDKGEESFDPVTEADRAAEKRMRALIGRRFPDHGISGEEWPDEPGTGPYSWSLDPVDGTRSFICGLPTWTTLIALLESDEPILGVIDAPVLEQTYVGFGEDARIMSYGELSSIRTSGCERLATARFSTTDPFLLDDPDALERIRHAVRVTRYGHDAYAYARLAGGSIDLVIESGLKPHDYNALIPVVRAAGGHIGDWQGGDRFASGAVVAAATRLLYDEAVELLARA
jgi:histidinol phosphatase-like enzyme (inositol monophosphatase family)